VTKHVYIGHNGRKGSNEWFNILKNISLFPYLIDLFHICEAATDVLPVNIEKE